jgi:hypothetical protein
MCSIASSFLIHQPTFERLLQKSFTSAVAQLPPPTTATFNLLFVVILANVKKNKRF